MNKFFDGMFCSYVGRISNTKVCSAVAFVTMTGMFIYLGVQKEIPEWMGWIYVSMVTPSRLMKNLIDLRWGRPPIQGGDK